MNENLKIFAISGISLIISFSILYIYLIESESFLSGEYDAKINQELQDDKKTIAIIGSSYVRSLNVTHISDHLTRNGYEHNLYTLFESSDYPHKRLENMQKVLSLNPSIVIFGVNFRELGYMSQASADLLPFSSKSCSQFSEKEAKEFVNSKKNNYDSESLFFQNLELDSGLIFNNKNPKHITMQNLAKIFYTTKNQAIESNPHRTSERLNHPLEEFRYFSDQPKKVIIDVGMIDKSIQPISQKNYVWCTTTFNEEIKAIIEIINILKNENIRIIFLLTPSSERFFIEQPDYIDKYSFEILEKVSNENEIEFYNFAHKYENLDVWLEGDDTHVGHNMKSLLYSIDISEIILNMKNTYVIMKNDNFQEMDLTNSDLSYLDLSYQNFSNTNFSNSVLSANNFIGSNLSNTNFSGAVITNMKIYNSIFENADFSNSTIGTVVFNNSSFPNANFSNSLIHKSHFINTDVTWDDLSNSKQISVKIID